MIFDSIYELIDKHNPVSNNQSGLRSNGSCNVFSAFDANPSLEFFGVFFDLSKAFDRAWHGGLLYTLKYNGING